MRTLLNRLLLPSPKFFLQLRKIMLALGITGVSLITAKTTYSNYLLFISDNFCGYLITAGVVGTFITSLTVEDNKKIQ